MKWFIQWMLPVLVLVSCSKENGGPAPAALPDPSPVPEASATGQMVLGKRLESPYLLENVRKAYSQLYPTRAGSGLDATDLYVRFLPKSAEELQLLESLDIDLFDYPLDREILSGGDWYHDPSLPEDQITWQYAVVPVGFSLPAGITCEVLSRCCFPGSEVLTRAAGDADWEAVERLAYELTGNAALLDEGTRGTKETPEGRITIVDSGFSDKRKVGVAGVQVKANVLLKCGSAYTDADGNYRMSVKFSAKPHYELKFKNTVGFKIGLNLVLVQASSSSLGKGAPDGLDFVVDGDAGGALYRRCVVNNAAYDYYRMCAVTGITAPPSNIRFWTLNFLRPSCALMTHHGALVDSDMTSKYLGVARAVLAFFSPDIVIGSKGKIGDYAALYRDTVHELSHATHFVQAGTPFWNKLVQYEFFSYFATTSPYGTGHAENAGYCEVAEMWAFYLENALYKDRYKKEDNRGLGYWFRPQILSEIESAGVSRAQICAALSADVTDTESFCKSLQATCSAKKTQIATVFSRYGK